MSVHTNGQHLPSQNGNLSKPSARQRGVLLLNLGTPDGPDVASVRRYLIEFLSDPEVIKLPRRMGWFNGPLARLIAHFRGPKSAEAYESIWTDRGSPLKVITEDQSAALQETLPNGWRVFYAMRYGNPSVEKALKDIVAADIERVVVIPMYPQYSGPTTKTAIADLYEQLGKVAPHLQISVRTAWYDDANYIDAQAELLANVIKERNLSPGSCHLVFSAHSMPKSYVEAGDPYQDHALRTVELVTHRLGWPRDRLTVSYQSKLGPVPWLEPSTADALKKLAEDGEENVLVCPLSFTADCLESIEEIGMGYREEFEASGGTLHLSEALNDFAPFIKALFQLTVRGPRPWNDRDAKRPPLLSFANDHTIEEVGLGSLVMIGVSLEGRLGDGDGPDVSHVSQQEFQCIKRPHGEVTTLLQSIKESGRFDECWLWNTCSRFELYGWLTADPNSEAGKQAIADTQRDLVGSLQGQVVTNLLAGAKAWHHLLRTATGLNSGLPGDGEVSTQLDAACRVAERCGTAGPLLEDLRDRVLDCQQELNTFTSWGRFRPEYCPIALKRVAVLQGLTWSTSKCVVIGGSVTSRSILHALRTQFEVPSEQLTAIHRAQSKGQQIKRLKDALGNGTVLRVDDYRDEEVLKAVLEADVVFFGIDSRQSVLDAERLQAARDFSAEPLTILDFNTFGSTAGLQDIMGLRLFDAQTLDDEVARFSEGMCDCPAFAVARGQAEEWLQHWLPGDDDHLCQPDCGGTCTTGVASAFRACPCQHADEPETCPRRVISERVA